MVNRCTFLSVCQTCEYMTDPESCPNYDEDFTRPYQTSSGKEEDEQKYSIPADRQKLRYYF